MRLMDRKTKMISFRVTTDEYRNMVGLCDAHGVRNISELARVALNHMVAAARTPGDLPIGEEVTDLRYRLQVLATEIDRLAERVNSNGNSRAAAQA